MPSATIIRLFYFDLEHFTENILRKTTTYHQKIFQIIQKKIRIA